MSRSAHRPRRSTRLVARNARYDYSQRRTQERQRYDVREYELIDAAWWGWGLDPCMRRRTWTKRLRRKVRELLARYCKECGRRMRGVGDVPRYCSHGMSGSIRFFAGTYTFIRC